MVIGCFILSIGGQAFDCSKWAGHDGNLLFLFDVGVNRKTRGRPSNFQRYND
jgi:hypothetical protein